ncbi:MAG TPA: hypothetical protein DDZ04_05150 [Parabacteroides sp.]|nr:hypothetical protein [Parabacteroides sp.]
MAKRKLSNSQIVCFTLLWGFLCYLLLSSSQKITGQTVFAIVASAIIVFVPIYKNYRGRSGKKKA